MGTHITFPRDTSPEISICLFTPPAMREPSPCLCANLSSIWSLAWDGICRGKSLWLETALTTELLTKQAVRQAGEMEWSCLSGVPGNQASHDYSLDAKSLAGFAILRGCHPESPLADQMLLVQMRLHHLLFAVEWPGEHSIRLSHISYLSHRSSRLRLPSRVASIRHVSSASAKFAQSVVGPC